jgi:hypothetical protein
MIFISNKYTIWYNSIINNAKTRTITGYTEKHHIIPKSLGGSNEKTNVVKLTAREHFVCHLLLTKMTTGNDRYKMIFALHMLSNVKNIGEGRYTASSKLYEYAKKSFKEALGQYWTSENRAKRAKQTKETATGRKWSVESKNNFKNKAWSDLAIQTRLENCLKSAEARKGSKWDEARHELKFQQYIDKNKHLFTPVFSLADEGVNIRQISLKLKISWDRVKYILDNRSRINNI